MKLVIGLTVLWLALCATLAHAENPPSYLAQWGSYGTGVGQFNYPTDMAIDAQGNIYVCDYGSHRIQKFDSQGNFLTAWGDNLHGMISITIGASGDIFVSDQANDQVRRFSPDGTLRLVWGSRGRDPGQFQTPAGIAASPDGRIYVVDKYNLRVQVFDENGTYLFHWGSPFVFAEPRCIAVAPGGNVYVSQRDEIQTFDHNGAYLFRWGTRGGGMGYFHETSGIAVDAVGNVLVADTGNAKIQKFTAGGTFLTQWGGPGTGNGEFNRPWGITFALDGTILVTDQSNHRIQRFGDVPTPALGTSWGRVKHDYRGRVIEH